MCRRVHGMMMMMMMMTIIIIIINLCGELLFYPTSLISGPLVPARSRYARQLIELRDELQVRRIIAPGQSRERVLYDGSAAPLRVRPRAAPTDSRWHGASIVGHRLSSLHPDQQLGTDEGQKNPNKDAEELLRHSVKKPFRKIGADEGDRNAEDECEQDVLL